MPVVNNEGHNKPRLTLHSSTATDSTETLHNVLSQEKTENLETSKHAGPSTQSGGALRWF